MTKKTNRQCSVRYGKILERLKNSAVDIVTQNRQTVQCEVMTDSGQTVEGSSGHSDTD